ncbi:hypothetical protein CCACVL1_24049 [Corchorus capsularis]|uniref:Pentacotripeptide-repeat region of PRORP domain-containing protein n=1 Tax=Corchorus capsularis TaxID=210143 RepID=A0A1R3GR66_COCAP|nr:hypothetical protein CCACVL1_24049 [Corchorus capsularis]
MGLARFLNSLSKTFVEPKIPSRCMRLFATHSQKSIKNQNFNLNSLPDLEFSFGYPPNVNLIISRSIHEDFASKKLPSEHYGKNPAEPKLEEEAARVCQLLSSRSDPHVDKLLENANIEVSPSLVAEVLKRLSNAGVIAMSFFTWAEKQKGFKYSTESYNALIEALGKIKQFRLIWNLVNDMKNRKLLSKDTFALISRRYARARKVEEAIRAFERMEEFGFKLETPDFNRLIDTLRWGKEQNLLRLDEIYREMTDEGFQPDVVTYGILIHAYCKAKKYDRAIELFHEMEAKNCKPSPHVFCTLINGLGSEKRLSQALEFFERSKNCGFAPEAPTYNALVGAYCCSMRIDDAFRVIDEMRKSSVGPNSRTYDIILHHLIKARRTNEAYLVFQKMTSEPGCEPTVWAQMKAKGVLPGMHMFSDLINSLCHANELDDACKYFQEMLDAGIRPPAKMFSNLKEALLDMGKKDIVLNLSRKIDNMRKTPLVGGGDQ